MLLHLPSVLGADAARTLTDSLAGAEFVDGRMTSADPSTSVKANLQLPKGSALADAIGEAVVRALLDTPAFARAARPRTIHRPQIARYDVGMHYGSHVDSAFMVDRQRIRSDVSVTVFLNGGSAYEGGDLVLQTDAGERHVRGEAGDAVLYPSTYVHRVTPVTRGTRLVAVTWVQSLVRSVEQRRVLYDLATAAEALSRGAVDQDPLQKLRQCEDNLLRMWAEL
jgi:PKHD-type hydroxylase